MALTIEARFWAKVDKQGPRFSNRGRCWLWTAYEDTNGYGQFRDGEQIVYAHRFAYGPVPRGLELDHLCRRTLCVRRSHLRAVPIGFNGRQGGARTGARLRAKTHCPAGHPYSGDNLVVPKVAPSRKGRPNRQCRTCNRERSRIWMRQHRANRSFSSLVQPRSAPPGVVAVTRHEARKGPVDRPRER